MRPKVKPVRSIEKFCGILMKLLDGSGERLAATQILNRSSNNSQCQALLWPQLGVGGLIDLSHAALADQGGDIVMAEPGADLQSHRLWGRHYRDVASGYTRSPT